MSKKAIVICCIIAIAFLFSGTVCVVKDDRSIGIIFVMVAALIFAVVANECSLRAKKSDSQGDQDCANDAERLPLPDDEVIRALKICSDVLSTCYGCPYEGNSSCGRYIARDALGIINSQAELIVDTKQELEEAYTIIEEEDLEQ